ncbi:hypothetical protein ACFL6Z_03840 [Pseudomonadota bacterium]
MIPNYVATMTIEIGTDANPIILTPESHLFGVKSIQLYEERKLLLEYSTFSDAEQLGLSEAKYEKDCDHYIANVISNVWLNHKELKVAIYLYLKLNDSGGDVFRVASREKNSKKKIGKNSTHIGEVGFITIGNDESTIKSSFVNIEGIDSLSNLIEADLGFIIDAPRLTGILRKLHRFSYITLTDINYWNTRDGLSELRSTFNEKKSFTVEDTLYNTSSRSVYKHIRICERMKRVWMVDKWKVKSSE